MLMPPPKRPFLAVSGYFLLGKANREASFMEERIGLHHWQGEVHHILPVFLLTVNMGSSQVEEELRISDVGFGHGGCGMGLRLGEKTD